VRSGVDFVSYNNEVPEHLQCFVARANRNEFDIASYEAALSKIPGRSQHHSERD